MLSVALQATLTAWWSASVDVMATSGRSDPFHGRRHLVSPIGGFGVRSRRQAWSGGSSGRYRPGTAIPERKTPARGRGQVFRTLLLQHAAKFSGRILRRVKDDGCTSFHNGRSELRESATS